MLSKSLYEFKTTVRFVTDLQVFCCLALKFNTVPRIPQTVLNTSKEFLNNKNPCFFGKSIFVKLCRKKTIWRQLFVWESRWCLRVRERVWDRPKKDYAQTHNVCFTLDWPIEDQSLLRNQFKTPPRDVFQILAYKRLKVFCDQLPKCHPLWPWDQE